MLIPANKNVMKQNMAEPVQSSLLEDNNDNDLIGFDPFTFNNNE